MDSVREAVERTVAETGEFTGKISLVAPACLRNFYLGAVIFLASEGSDFITGQTINVDGGVNMY